MRLNIKKTALAVALILSMPAAHANIQDKLNGFMDNFAVTGSEPGMYQGQSAGYLSGGSMMLRSPMQTTQLFSITPPNFRAGCGGIDLFLGSFSFINMDQLVQMAKSIGSAAVSTAFYLALDSMSPELSSLMKQIQEWANKMNEFNINSCEAGARMAGSFAREMGYKQDRCNADQHAGGDAFAAKYACATDGWDFSWVPGLGDGDTKKENLKQVTGNIVWTALARDAKFNDADLMELVMSVTGTVVYPPGNTKDNPTKAQLYVSLVSPSELLGDTSTARLELYRCDDTSTVSLKESRCTGVSKMTNQEHPGKKLQQRISDALNNADAAANAYQALSPDTIKIINMTDVPVFALIQAAADARAMGVVTGQGKFDAFARLIYIEIIASLMNKSLGQVMSALANDSEQTAGSDQQRLILTQNMEFYAQKISEERALIQAKTGDLFTIYNQIQFLKRTAQTRYAPLSDRLRFAQQTLSRT